MGKKKIIKKKDLKFEQGYCVKGSKIIGLPTQVALQLDRLELMVQQFLYLKGQKPYQAGPSLDGFERESAFDHPVVELRMPDTPVTDARVEEAVKFMEEVNAVSAVNEVNNQLARFSDLVNWCDDKKFVEGDWTRRIDTPMIGNPLKLKPRYIVGILRRIADSPIDMSEY